MWYTKNINKINFSTSSVTYRMDTVDGVAAAAMINRNQMIKLRTIFPKISILLFQNTISIFGLVCVRVCYSVFEYNICTKLKLKAI